jgi:hypothetical protein
MRNLLIAFALLISPACLVSANSIFITGEIPFGTATPFFVTNNGITASFSSPADPGGFETAPTSFSFGPEVVLDPGPAGASFIALDIFFSAPISLISMDFATEGVGPLNLVALLGFGAVGAASATGTIPPGGVSPEGIISFSGVIFDGVRLNSIADPNFAIGNISVTPTPEPGSWVLLATIVCTSLIVLVYTARLARPKGPIL